MRRHRFYLPAVTEQTQAITNRMLIHQIRDVLRAKVGDEILLWTSEDPAYARDCVFEITHIASSRIDGVVSSIMKNDREPRVSVVLYCALLKRENLEVVLQKTTEVGVSVFVPLITERTVKTGLNRRRSEEIIREAAEQSGRGILPVLQELVTLGEALEQMRGSERYFFHTNVIPDEHSLFRAKGGIPKLSVDTHGIPPARDGQVDQSRDDREGERVSIFIGPEGGWTDAEVEQARAAGCHIASLGPLTLRAETAAIIASYLLCHHGDTQK